MPSSPLFDETDAKAEAGTDPSDLLSTSDAGPAAVRGGAMRVGGYVVGALVSVLSGALLFRHLGVADTGRYVNALAIVAIVGAVSDLGLTAVGVRELSQRPADERWPLARDLLGLRITLTMVGGAIATAVAWSAYSSTLGKGVALACIGLLFTAMQDNFALPLVIGLRLGWVAALELARQLLSILLTIALVLAGARLLPFLGMSIPVGAVVLVATAVLVRRTRTLSPTFSWSRWRRFMSAMIPYSAAIAASALYFRISILLVSALSNSRQLGYFSASFRIVEVLTIIPGLLASAALPIFARAAHDDHDRLGYSLGKVFEVALMVGAWMSVSIAVGAPLAIAIVGGAKFNPAVPVLAFQGLGLGAMFVSLVWANGLLGLGLYRVILTLSLAALLVNAMLVTPLVLLDGARGAAIGTAVAEVLLAVVQCLAVARGRPQLKPSLQSLPKVALASALGLLPLLLPGIPTIARLVLSTILYIGVLLVTRAVPEEMMDLLPGFLAKWIVGRAHSSS